MMEVQEMQKGSSSLFQSWHPTLHLPPVMCCKTCASSLLPGADVSTGFNLKWCYIPSRLLYKRMQQLIYSYLGGATNKYFNYGVYLLTWHCKAIIYIRVAVPGKAIASYTQKRNHRRIWMLYMVLYIVGIQQTEITYSFTLCIGNISVTGCNDFGLWNNVTFSNEWEGVWVITSCTQKRDNCMLLIHIA